MKIKINKLQYNDIPINENNYNEYIENREKSTYLKKEIPRETISKQSIPKPKLVKSRSKENIFELSELKLKHTDTSIRKKLKDDLYTRYVLQKIYKENG